MDMRVRALKLLAKGLNAVCSESRDGHACTRAETFGVDQIERWSRPEMDMRVRALKLSFVHRLQLPELCPEMDMRVRALKQTA